MQKTVSRLNALLRGELAAVDTYQQALEKVGGEAGADEISRIHAEHVNAVTALRQYVVREGGNPEDGPGMWGTFAKAVEGMAKLIGKQPFHGLRYQGRRFDCGDKAGWLEAQIAFALERPDMAPAVREFLKRYA